MPLPGEELLAIRDVQIIESLPLVAIHVMKKLIMIIYHIVDTTLENFGVYRLRAIVDQ